MGREFKPALLPLIDLLAEIAVQDAIAEMEAAKQKPRRKIERRPIRILAMKGAKAAETGK